MYRTMILFVLLFNLLYIFNLTFSFVYFIVFFLRCIFHILKIKNDFFFKLTMCKIIYYKNINNKKINSELLYNITL